MKYNRHSVCRYIIHIIYDILTRSSFQKKKKMSMGRALVTKLFFHDRERTAKTTPITVDKPERASTVASVAEL